jgi:hypothetical protein
MNEQQEFFLFFGEHRSNLAPFVAAKITAAETLPYIAVIYPA